MPRRVEPELLDLLPADDAGALGSRRDLRRLNAFMGNADAMARALLLAFPEPSPRRLAELGAGDGCFLASVAQRLGPEWSNGVAVLVDRLETARPEPERRLKKLGWHVATVMADALHWLEQSSTGHYDAIISNLFLHQLPEPQLRLLLRCAAGRARAFVAVEPRRSMWRLLVSRMVWAIGCNRVTCHDAPTSVRAGFSGQELSQLWPADEGWLLHEGRSGAFGHLFVARRRELTAERGRLRAE